MQVASTLTPQQVCLQLAAQNKMDSWGCSYHMVDRMLELTETQIMGAGYECIMNAWLNIVCYAATLQSTVLGLGSSCAAQGSSRPSLGAEHLTGMCCLTCCCVCSALVLQVNCRAQLCRVPVPGVYLSWAAFMMHAHELDRWAASYRLCMMGNTKGVMGQTAQK
jgi:hypothetical protein